MFCFLRYKPSYKRSYTSHSKTRNWTNMANSWRSTCPYDVY